MRFRLNKLLGAPVGTRQVEMLDRGRTWLDDELQVAYLRGEFTFTRTNESILIEGTIDTATNVQCVRSLEIFELPLSVTLDDVAFTLPGFPALEPDRRIREDGHIDLTETIREAIIMAIPINPISPKYQDANTVENLMDGDDSDWLTVWWADSDDSGRGDTP
jgi:uncharacterized metal-binding protein YceD (DUF177 family)